MLAELRAELVSPEFQVSNGAVFRWLLREERARRRRA
jgi:hypothetical protein